MTLSILIWKILPGIDSNCRPRILNSETESWELDGKFKTFKEVPEGQIGFPSWFLFSLSFQIYFILKKKKHKQAYNPSPDPISNYITK